MRDFIDQRSIVRTIWGNPNIILLIFAGSAAEFALNRAVDWLFFTGRIPADPIGRLFSTVRYSQEILFADEDTARRTLTLSTQHIIRSSDAASKQFRIGLTGMSFICSLITRNALTSCFTDPS